MSTGGIFMIKKINDFLAGWPMTIIGGVFLLASFILPRIGYPAGENLAWVCVMICGLPLLVPGHLEDHIQQRNQQDFLRSADLHGNDCRNSASAISLQRVKWPLSWKSGHCLRI